MSRTNPHGTAPSSPQSNVVPMKRRERNDVEDPGDGETLKAEGKRLRKRAAPEETPDETSEELRAGLDLPEDSVALEHEGDTSDSETDPDLDDEDESIPLSLSARLASALFVSTRPLSLETLCSITRSGKDDVLAALDYAKDLFQDDMHGFSLHEVAGAFQFRTARGSARTIHRLIPARARKLSRAAAETLAVVAYRQPVQRAEIEAIRGVDALPTLKTLLDARLVRIVGRDDSPGQPALYGTTQGFLEKFGLRDLSELPTPRELVQLSDEPGE